MTDEEALELKPGDRVRVIAGENEEQRARIGQIGCVVSAESGSSDVIIHLKFSDGIAMGLYAYKLELLTATAEDLQKALAEAEQELQSWPSP